MGCNSCNKGSNGLPRGCNNNGNCASGTCGTFTSSCAQKNKNSQLDLDPISRKPRPRIIT